MKQLKHSNYCYGQTYHETRNSNQNFVSASAREGYNAGADALIKLMASFT